MPRVPVYKVGDTPSQEEVTKAWRRMFPGSPIAQPNSPSYLGQLLSLMINHNPKRLSHEINRVRGWAFDLEDLK